MKTCRMRMTYLILILKSLLTTFKGLFYFENTQKIQNRWTVKELISIISVAFTLYLLTEFIHPCDANKQDA